MNRYQLYELVKPHLAQLSLTNPDTFCDFNFYMHMNTCQNCPFYEKTNQDILCLLDFRRESVKQLKEDILIKHPELLI